jgi:hypothetical protein
VRVSAAEVQGFKLPSKMSIATRRLWKIGGQNR